MVRNRADSKSMWQDSQTDYSGVTLTCKPAPHSPPWRTNRLKASFVSMATAADGDDVTNNWRWQVIPSVLLAQTSQSLVM